MQNISDEFDFRLDRTTDYGVSCPWAPKKIPYTYNGKNCFSMLARSFLVESSSKLPVFRTGIKARTSSIRASGFKAQFICLFFFWNERMSNSACGWSKNMFDCPSLLHIIHKGLSVSLVSNRLLNQEMSLEKGITCTTDIYVVEHIAFVFLHSNQLRTSQTSNKGRVCVNFVYIRYNLWQTTFVMSLGVSNFIHTFS